MSEWRPIETAPKDGTRILLFWPRYAYNNDEVAEPFVGIGFYKTNRRIECLTTEERGSLLPSYFADTDEWDDYGLAYPEHAATQWMPLPNPPIQEKFYRYDGYAQRDLTDEEIIRLRASAIFLELYAFSAAMGCEGHVVWPGA